MSTRAYIAAVNLVRECTGLAVGPSCVGPEREVAIRASSPYVHALSGYVIEPDPRHCYVVVIHKSCELVILRLAQDRHKMAAAGFALTARFLPLDRRRAFPEAVVRLQRRRRRGRWTAGRRAAHADDQQQRSRGGARGSHAHYAIRDLLHSDSTVDPNLRAADAKRSHPYQYSYGIPLLYE